MDDYQASVIPHCNIKALNQPCFQLPRSHYLSDDYKASVISAMSTNQLIDTLLINPSVNLSPSYRDTGLTATYSFQPLSNLVYTRDQQVGPADVPLLLPLCLGSSAIMAASLAVARYVILLLCFVFGFCCDNGCLLPWHVTSSPSRCQTLGTRGSGGAS